MSFGDTQSQPELVITVTESIRLFLLSASNDPCLSQEFRQLALNLSSRTNAPYKPIRSIWIGSDVGTRPKLISLFSGSDFVFTSPKLREKSEELKQRLRKLKEIAERKEYEDLVKDITPKKDLNEPFSNYKDQLGFGLHVALIMFTGYLGGYFAFRALFNHNSTMNAAGGILGLVLGMLLETLLFIIRTSNPDFKSSSSTSRLKKNQ
ncbi:ATPase [Theobroma cacao]|nr:ATPase [Theobroma cacao]